MALYPYNPDGKPVGLLLKLLVFGASFGFLSWLGWVIGRAIAQASF